MEFEPYRLFSLSNIFGLIKIMTLELDLCDRYEETSSCNDDSYPFQEKQDDDLYGGKEL